MKVTVTSASANKAAILLRNLINLSGLTYLTRYQQYSYYKTNYRISSRFKFKKAIKNYYRYINNKKKIVLD